jgi:hypothetical protein
VARTKLQMAVCVLALCSAVACSTEPTAPGVPVTPSATGVWQGTFVTDFGGTRLVRLDMQEASGALSGTGTIAAPPGPPYWFMTISGTHADPSISLTLTSSDPNSPGVDHLPGTFTDANTITTVLNNTGCTNCGLILRRQ